MTPDLIWFLILAAVFCGWLAMLFWIGDTSLGPVLSGFVMGLATAAYGAGLWLVVTRI